MLINHLHLFKNANGVTMRDLPNFGERLTPLVTGQRKRNINQHGEKCSVDARQVLGRQCWVDVWRPLSRIFSPSMFVRISCCIWCQNKMLKMHLFLIRALWWQSWNCICDKMANLIFSYISNFSSAIIGHFLNVNTLLATIGPWSKKKKFRFFEKKWSGYKLAD